MCPTLTSVQPLPEFLILPWKAKNSEFLIGLVSISFGRPGSALVLVAVALTRKVVVCFARYPHGLGLYLTTLRSL